MGRNKKSVPAWAKLNHPRPTTRREFLATGIIPFTAWAVGPSLGSLLLPSLAGAATNCSASAAASYIPFITLNLSGGPSLASQLVVKNLAGGNLSSYTKLGLGSGPGLSFNPVMEFGNVEFSGTAIGGNTTGLVSKFLTGVRDPRNQGTRIAALDKTAFVWSTVALNDDTANNQLDVSGLVVKMGLTGSKLPNLGRNDTSTGISQKASMLPPPAPFVVNQVSDLADALGYASGVASLSVAQKSSLAKVIANLSGPQIRRIASTTGANLLAQTLDCAGIRNVDLIATGGGDVSPLDVAGATATNLASIWKINANDRTSQNAVFASMVYNGLVGNASTVGLNLGGYDYHDGTRTTGDGKDLAAGQIVGMILDTAAYLGKPVFIYVCADGATVSAESSTADGAWMSDRGIAGMQYMLSYSPAGRPITTGFQVGGFNDGQAADGKFPTSTAADQAAQAVFTNYAALNGRQDFLDQYRILGDANLRALVTKFQKG